MTPQEFGVRVRLDERVEGEHVHGGLEVPQHRRAMPLQQLEHSTVKRVRLAHVAVHQPRQIARVRERRRQSGRYGSSFPSGPGIRSRPSPPSCTSSSSTGTCRRASSGRPRPARSADRCVGWRPPAVGWAPGIPTSAVTGTEDRRPPVGSVPWSRSGVTRSRRRGRRPPRRRSRGGGRRCPRS